MLGRFSYVLLPTIPWILTGMILVMGGRRRIVGVIGVMMIGIALGAWRGASMERQLQVWHGLADHAVVLQVTAAEDGVYNKYGQMSFAANHVINLQTGRQLPGQISAAGLGLNAVFQGDVVLVEGKLRSGLGSYQGFMSYADFTLLKHHDSLLLDVRRKFGAAVLSVLPEPLGSFAMGLLIGQRATLPDNVKTDLQKVGLTHIIAVSGANLTIMLTAGKRLLGKHSKRMSFAFSLLLMLGFVAITGGSASIVRAGWVSGLSLLAAYYGHTFKPLVIIMAVAAGTSLINPLYVWGDASWYLSFLAFFGILMVAPLVHARLLPAFSRNLILMIAIESLCAEIMSIPYILLTFGQISFVGLLANVLVVSAIPYAMLLGFIAGLAGLFLWPVAGWLAWPARIILEYMLGISQWLANLPHIFNGDIWLNGIGAGLLYVTTVGLVLLLHWKDRRQSVKMTV